MTSDQRGYARPDDATEGACDIGAYESGPALVTGTGQADPEHGGTLRATYGGQTLIVSIPPGAVDDTTLLTATAPLFIPPPPNGTVAIGFPFDLAATLRDGHPVTTFKKPVTLTFSYPVDFINPTEIAFYDSAARRWVALDPSMYVIDPVRNTISARTTHFTLYGLFGASSTAATPTPSETSAPATLSPTATQTTVLPAATSTQGPSMPTATPSALPGPSATPELGSGGLLGSGLVSLGGVLLYYRYRQKRGRNKHERTDDSDTGASP